jgi:hypothetical protein
MRRDQRQIYIELAKEINASLCTFCSYGEWEAEDCCSGYNICNHPIDALSTENRCEEMLEPGSDCYGFHPDMPVALIADIVGAALVEGWQEWAFRRYAPRQVTVYGRSFKNGVETSSKVRIGHEGKPKINTM